MGALPMPISSCVTKGRRFVVRLGDDNPVHGIVRANELMIPRAAHGAGLSPAIVHAEPGALVMDFIDGETLGPGQVRDAPVRDDIVALIRRVHADVAPRLEGTAPKFWPFQVARHYFNVLARDNSIWADALPRLAAINDELEHASSPIDIVLGHNDLLAANFIDDGDRLWLLDWEYAGFNSPLFDLANLASNNEFDRDAETDLLKAYFATSPDAGNFRRFAAMKAASLMRETLWSMASEIHSAINFDYGAYTRENLERFEAALDAFRAVSP
jgi:thiamine kinase-like enzyme